MHGLIIKEFTALNPKVYSVIHEHFDKDKNTIVEKNTQKLKGVSKAVIKTKLLIRIMLMFGKLINH